ncbi:MAG: DUF2723 domain-containing protein [Anaerolineae bacterium]|nr:DUF2723 domain-containing protein [Anaerolineae bacterium]
MPARADAQEAWQDTARVRAALTAAGAGLVLGAFLSRVLADMPSMRLPTYRWGPAALLTITVGALIAAAWWRWGKGSGASLLPLYALALYLPQPAPNLLQASILFASAVVVCLVLAMPRLRLRDDRLIGALLFAAALAAYLSTLTPGVGTRDGYELQAVSATLGFAHPTGYPLFPILGRLWLLVYPFGSIARRINVLCALYAAASVPLLYLTARRVLDARTVVARPVAALGALLFAFSHTLWTQAVRPEKYTLNALFVALVLYVAFGSTDPEARGPHPHLRWLALTYGLSLGHHRTMLMLAPALALYLLWRDPGILRRPRTWLPALGLALAPLLVYLYIPWRAATQGWIMSVPEFLQYIAGADYGPAVRLMDWANRARVHMFWRFLLQQYGYPGVVLGALGWLRLLLRRRWRTVACTTLAYATYYVWGTVWYAYYNDVNSFIPNHMIDALWIASGALALWETAQWIAQRERARAVASRASGYAAAAFWSLLALYPARLVWHNGPQVDARAERNLSEWGAYAIAQPIAPGATLLADREKHPPLDYHARIEGRRPDLDVVLLGDEQAYRDRLAWDLAQGKSVYLARFLPGLEGAYHLRSLGPLVEVGTAPRTPGVNAGREGVSFGEQVRLLGHEIEAPGPRHAGEPLRVTLTWYAAERVTDNREVNLRLVGQDGQVWWSSAAHPVSGMYPTGAWKPGEVIPDWHEVSIPAATPPGVYALQVALAAPFAIEGLPNGEGTWLALEEIVVAPPDPAAAKPAIAQRLRAIAPGAWQIVGYDLPSQAPPTGRVRLTLYWQALAPLPDLEIGTRVWGATDGAWTWSPPGDGAYPTSQWTPGATIITEHALVMPATHGVYRVQVGVRNASTRDRVSFVAGWLRVEDTALSLPPLTVAGRAPAAAGTVNYADRILLLEVHPDAERLAPGEALSLEVRWECLQAMEDDYTLTVQLIAPDGSLRGQADGWPQEGTHPTSAWVEGEAIEDRYVVRLDPDAPSGSYRIAIGWYLLETMQRLPVLDATGRATGDVLELPGPTVSP